MLIQYIAFYVFAAVVVASAFMVIAARNPVHSVLFLILAFFNSAGLFVLAGAEFLAMTLVIVYVGGVAVLFLFVVMMLDINFVRLRQGFMQYLPVGAMLGAVLLVELLLVVGAMTIKPDIEALAAPMPPVERQSNTHALGELLYTRYMYPFQVAGMVLLAAMIGAIVLTFRVRTGVCKQNISAQVARRRADAVEMKKVVPRAGVSGGL
ncbi:MAG: NADH-quinone oxidoreductase subunit J [Alphaproteobacteria bacterium]|nr:NADH-quinone oxidoreductase subunit J [Alphaproteobacteria bacterium]